MEPGDGPYAKLDYSLLPIHDLAARSPGLLQLASEVADAVTRARSAGSRPPSHVTLPAAEFDALWLECGKPDRMTVWGVEVRRDGGA